MNEEELKMTHEELQEMLDEADRDGDGEVKGGVLPIMKKTNLLSVLSLIWALASLWLCCQLQHLDSWSFECGAFRSKKIARIFIQRFMRVQEFANVH